MKKDKMLSPILIYKCEKIYEKRNNKDYVYQKIYYICKDGSFKERIIPLKAKVFVPHYGALTIPDTELVLYPPKDIMSDAVKLKKFII